MKTRQGFVSNSSTSSFMIYGYWLHDEENLNEKLGEITSIDEYGEEYYLMDDCGNVKGIFENIVEGTDLGVYTDDESRGYFIGINPSNLDKNKSLNDQSEAIKDNIIKTFEAHNIEIESFLNECDFYSGTYYC